MEKLLLKTEDGREFLVPEDEFMFYFEECQLVGEDFLKELGIELSETEWRCDYGAD